MATTTGELMPRTALTSAGGYLGAAAAALLALVLAWPYLDHVPDYDEFYTLLAARGWLETGAPAIADGEYTRAFAFTLTQAAFFSVFGESLIVARLPSLISVMVLAAGLYLWVRHVAGTGAAALSAVFFAFNPLTVEMAQFGRFYAPQALAIGATALCVYYACRATGTRRIGLAAGALFGAALAYELQATTVIALCAFAFWVAVVVADRLLRAAPTPAAKGRVVGALAGAALVMAAGLWLSGLAEMFWKEFQTTTYWGATESRAGNIRFYHQTLDKNLGIFWSLVPIAAAVAIVRRRSEMLFLATFVGITLALHSLAAQKDERYVFYIAPFIAALLGAGLATAICHYAAWLRRGTPAVLEPAGLRRFAAPVAGVVAAATVLFVFANNPPVADMLRMLAGAPSVERLDYSWVANWPAEVETVKPLVAPPTILVTSSGMKAVYYLGDYDFELNANVADETDTRQDFGIDPRTGRQVLSRPESVELLLRCYPHIVFVADESRWSRDTAVPVATSALIEARAERVPTEPDSKLLVFKVSNPAASPSAEFCKEFRPGRR
jgi:4-amino-4-deoxy-L-arabinose transferase-like glycosyltransferase